MEENLKEYYSNIIDSVNDGLIVLNAEENVTLMNPTAEEITGVSKRQAQGNHFRSIFSNEPTLLEMVSKTATTGMTINDHENIVLQTGGRQTPVSATTSPLLQDDGKRIGTILILRDLTGVRDLEYTVRHTDRLAILGTVAVGLAHEVKNPLGGIKGAAQLLELELSENSDLRDYTRIMLREVDRVNHIVEELLDLASPRKLKLSLVNLHKILDDIIILLKQAVGKTDITFQQHFDPSIPPLMADADLLTQLFLNLAKNAVDAVGDSGVIKTTSRVLSDYSMTRKGARRSRMVAIEVSDNGPGIPPEQMENLFTPFFTTKSKGTGLGLAICQKIVAEHRGMIKVDSKSGKGTTFTVMFPLIQ